ncbi:MAG: hypothetical protein N2235_22990 [Fischerella sp.]|nr:hypothetical protein [Fischerella sp.]
MAYYTDINRKYWQELDVLCQIEMCHNQEEEWNREGVREIQSEFKDYLCRWHSRLLPPTS